jgi:hypothetical protein
MHVILLSSGVGAFFASNSHTWYLQGGAQNDPVFDLLITSLLQLQY